MCCFYLKGGWVGGGAEAFDGVPKIGTTATIRNMAATFFASLKGYWSDPSP